MDFNKQSVQLRTHSGENTAENTSRKSLYFTVSNAELISSQRKKLPKKLSTVSTCYFSTNSNDEVAPSPAHEMDKEVNDATTLVWSTECSEEEEQRNSKTETLINTCVLSRIATLSALREEGFIDEEEFQRRKVAIIDEIAPAKSAAMYNPLADSTRGCPRLITRPPNFEGIEMEEAVKHIFNFETRSWENEKVYVKLDDQPFAKGSLRLVYHLQNLGSALSSGSFGGDDDTYVAKLAIDPDEDAQIYFRDIELQDHCAHYAELYNCYNPPKKVNFIKAWVLELTQRNGALCAVEKYIPGEYRKHNNNFGCVSDEERNTPQAFSHFTYEASKHELLAVDIQGVGDQYTDPQIHTLNGDDFGKGNLGRYGFKKFLSSHRCNPICLYLKLPLVNPKNEMNDCGTVPIQKLMQSEAIRSSHFESKHYYENAPLLKKYISQCREDEIKQPRHGFTDNSNNFCGCSCSIQ